MKKSLFLAVFLLTLLPAVTELGIGVCWAQSYMEEMMSWSMCFNDTRGYYTVFDNDCGNDKECRECLLCGDNWVIEDLYEEHLLMAHGIGGDPDGPNDPDPDPSSGNGDPDEPEGLGTSGGTGEGNTSATGYGEPDSEILLPQVNVNGHYEPPTPDFMLDNQNYSNDGIGYIGGGGGRSENSSDNKASSSKQEYTLKETDHLSVNIKILNNLKGFKQGTNNTCVCAGAEYIAKALGNTQITEGTALTALVKEFGLGAVLGTFSTDNSDFDGDKLCSTLSNHAIENGLQATSNITDFKSAIDEGFLIMTDYLVSSGVNEQTGKPYNDYHDVVIVGYNDDGFIVYDTDISAGNYKVYPVDELGELYSVGIKK